MLLLLALACTPHGDKAPSDRTSRPGGDDTGDTDDTDDTGDTGTPVDGCRSADKSAADRDRAVLVSLPYDEDANQADTWAVLTLDRDGALADGGHRITMGRATAGEVTFTPDGSLALAATQDGKLGVYDAVNDVVVEAEWDGGFYAERIVADPSGEVAWVVDGNWANNGGGLYRVALDCTTGAPSGAERVLEAKLPADLLWTDGGALFVGREVPGTSDGDDLARLAWTDDVPAVTGGVDVFGDDEAIVSDAALAGGWALVGDISEFSGIPTRIGRVRVGDTLSAEEPVEIEDPIALWPFPDGSARALVASGYGDALFVLDAESGAAERVSATRVQLPGALSGVTRGPQAGLVLVSEVEGVRRVRLGDGAEDLGVFSLGEGLASLPGAVGVAP